ncbi:hypothetical protein AAFP32_01965 [Brevibacterium sp. CBA3109]|uniref:GHKL domain-containing protein n=1 Tax=Brevibacterium koreense TaxID=3140787 RepID=A0AAU7UMA0_9MICO
MATLIELGRSSEALDFAVRDEQESQRLTDSFVDSLDEPFITALMIGKVAQAHERGIELTLSATGELPPGSLDARDLVTVAGNLLDNAFVAAAESAAASCVGGLRGSRWGAHHFDRRFRTGCGRDGPGCDLPPRRNG